MKIFAQELAVVIDQARPAPGLNIDDAKSQYTLGWGMGCNSAREFIANHAVHYLSQYAEFTELERAEFFRAAGVTDLGLDKY